MVEGASLAGGAIGPIQFPGIIPAAINEASEIMAQLNKPFRTVQKFEYDKFGNITQITTDVVTPLMLILLISGPAAVVAVMKILELASGTGRALGGGAAALGEAAQGIVGAAVESTKKAGGTVFDLFGEIWKLSGEIPGFR